MTAEQEREDCRKVVEEAVSTCRLPTSGRCDEFFYFPDMFKEPAQDECMFLVQGTEGAKELYQTLLRFWVYTFFGFVEIQGFQEKFEPQAREALCERVNEATMQAQIRECKAKAQPQPYARGFGLRGRRIAIYRMFNDEKRVSFAVETTQNYYAFFYERQTGYYHSGVRVFPAPYQLLNKIMKSPAFKTLPDKEKKYMKWLYREGELQGRYRIERVRKVYNRICEIEAEGQE
jgi:hypothetical protein